MGKRLKHVRSGVMRMTQRDLKDAVVRLGVDIRSHTTVGRYERGDVPGVDYLVALGILSGISPLWLMTGQGPKQWDSVGDGEFAGGVRHATGLMTVLVRQLSVGFGAPDVPGADSGTMRALAEALEQLLPATDEQDRQVAR